MSIMDEEVDRIAAAQAADEMLNLEGVRGAFVLYPKEDVIYISARSMGEVNVQVILEPLGGGGNATMAGGQIRERSMAQVKRELLDSIDQYFAE